MENKMQEMVNTMLSAASSLYVHAVKDLRRVDSGEIHESYRGAFESRLESAGELRGLLRRARTPEELASALAPQPPAEAQAVPPSAPAPVAGDAAEVIEEMRSRMSSRGRVGDGPVYGGELIDWANRLEAALAQQPAADGGFTAADMMDARQEGRKEAQQQAERLAEALALLPDEIDMIENNPDEGMLMSCCGREVKSRGLHDLLITHDKGCWYVSMCALRDHDNGRAPEFVRCGDGTYRAFKGEGDD